HSGRSSDSVSEIGREERIVEIVFIIELTHLILSLLFLIEFVIANHKHEKHSEGSDILLLLDKRRFLKILDQLIQFVLVHSATGKEDILISIRKDHILQNVDIRKDIHILISIGFNV